jgi:predicted site-specific integrase-resolvase
MIPHNSPRRKNMSTQPKTVAIYARVSTDKQKVDMQLNQAGKSIKNLLMKAIQVLIQKDLPFQK